MNSIALSDFFKKQYLTSSQELPLEEILARVQANIANAVQGYRSGVLLVPIPVDGLFAEVGDLEVDEKIEGTFVARMPHELPRKDFWVTRSKLPPAKRADVVLYHRDVLQEGNEASSGSDWEIIKLLAHSGTTSLPLPPDTLCYNHFVMDGGTSTLMSSEEFTTALEESFRFWANKVNIRKI